VSASPGTAIAAAASVAATSTELRNGMLQTVAVSASQTTTTNQPKTAASTPAPASARSIVGQKPSSNDTVTVSGVTYSPAQIGRSSETIRIQFAEVIDYFLSTPEESYTYSGNDIISTLTAFQGYANTKIGVHDTLSRAQAASVLARTFGLQRSATAKAGESNFSDVNPKDVHAANIDALYENGVTAGCATAPLRFCPAQAITRRQFATMLGKAMQRTGRYTLNVTYTSFNDVAQGSNGYAQIAFVDGYNLLQPCSGSGGTRMFCPDQPLIRGEAIRMLARYFHVTNNL